MEQDKSSFYEKYQKAKNTAKEIAIVNLVVATSAAILMNAALNPPQRRAIRERDDNQCQFPGEHDCGGKGFQVHHISPQRWEKDIAIPEEIRDRPENLITLCEFSHTREVHPDITEAKKNYGKDRGSFEKTFAARDKQLEERKPYWNTIFDAKMFKVARERTAAARENGWLFPKKDERKKPENP